jgi:hypothetical protein
MKKVLIIIVAVMLFPITIVVVSILIEKSMKALEHLDNY